MNFLIKKSQPDLIGIDLNEEQLKIVHVRVSSLKREVMTLASREVRGMSDEDIVAFIKQTIVDLKIANPRAFLAVPLHTVITRTIEIPSRDPEEIREIVSLQASRHTPYSRSEITLDTLTLGIVRETYTKVLLVIVPKELIARQTKILEKANLKIERIFFPPEGICYACSKILGSESSDAAIAIVHMDTTFTSFIVIQKNKILFVRGISVGAEQLLEEKEATSDRFIEELQKTLESYVMDEAGPKPSELLLTGVVAEITDLDDLFSGTLHMPIRHQTYFNHFAISDKAREVASSSKRVSYFNLIAPLLLFDRMKIDLISEERKLQIGLEKRGREMMKTGILLMIFFVLSFIFVTGKIYFKSVYLTNLKARYKPVREDAKNLERLFLKTQTVKDTLAGRGRSLETLIELYDALPKDIRISDIKYEDGDKFSVKGTSKTMASVFAFVSSLDKSSHFKNVKTKYVTTRSENGADVADFEATMSIKKESTP
ncbi:MAG: hypothetical protein AUJ72_05065 [Candidatus Omnitrophica bacterium CG1_02_46_14]|nr:MAG: hypothetical protein AUJ72_05065 [Candidatus Omnitrophica bacterium CG1_02_46_14]